MPILAVCVCVCVCLRVCTGGRCCMCVSGVCWFSSLSDGAVDRMSLNLAASFSATSSTAGSLPLSPPLSLLPCLPHTENHMHTHAPSTNLRTTSIKSLLKNKMFSFNSLYCSAFKSPVTSLTHSQCSSSPHRWWTRERSGFSLQCELYTSLWWMLMTVVKLLTLNLKL